MTTTYLAGTGREQLDAAQAELLEHLLSARWILQEMISGIEGGAVPKGWPSAPAPMAVGHRVQSCQLKPVTRPNSEVLAVTTVNPRRSAWPAISRS